MPALFRRFFALALLAALSVPAAAQPSADALLERLQTKYSDVDGLRAEFTQTLQSPYMDADERFSGRVLLRGDRYRVETGQQTIVTDGETVWIYSPASNQVIVNDYVEDETAFSLNDFLFDYAERYDPQSVEAVQHGGERHYRLVLAPQNDDAFYREVTFFLRDRDDVVSRVEVLDANESRIVFDLTGVELNPAGLTDAAFRFNPSADASGAEIVDMRM